MSNMSDSGLLRAVGVAADTAATRVSGIIEPHLENLKATTTEIKTDIKEMRAAQIAHEREDDGRFAEIDKRASIAEAKAEAAKGAGKPAWLAIAAAIGTGIAALVKSLLPHKLG